MRISKRIVFCILYSVSVAVCTPLYAQIGMESLADSLTAFTGFSSLWSPPVKVKNLRVSGKNVTVKTNKTLMDVRWTPQNVAHLKRNVSRWVLGHEKGRVTTDYQDYLEAQWVKALREKYEVKVNQEVWEKIKR